MKNLSTAFKRALANNERNYLTYADITLADNTVLNSEVVNIMSVQDCFWVITPNNCTFTAAQYTPRITESSA